MQGKCAVVLLHKRCLPQICPSRGRNHGHDFRFSACLTRLQQNIMNALFRPQRLADRLGDVVDDSLPLFLFSSCATPGLLSCLIHPLRREVLHHGNDLTYHTFQYWFDVRKQYLVHTSIAFMIALRWGGKARHTKRSAGHQLNENLFGSL